MIYPDASRDAPPTIADFPEHFFLRLHGSDLPRLVRPTQPGHGFSHNDRPSTQWPAIKGDRHLPSLSTCSSMSSRQQRSWMWCDLPGHIPFSQTWCLSGSQQCGPLGSRSRWRHLACCWGTRGWAALPGRTGSGGWICGGHRRSSLCVSRGQSPETGGSGCEPGEGVGVRRKVIFRTFGLRNSWLEGTAQVVGVKRQAWFLALSLVSSVKFSHL